MKSVINFIKSLLNAIPAQCAKNAANNVEKCGSVPKASDIRIFRQPIGTGGSRYDFTEITYNTPGSYGVKDLGNFDQKQAASCPDSVFANMAEEQAFNRAFAKESNKLFWQSVKDWAKVAGTFAAGYAASQLVGCAPGGKEQELYDVFDTAQLEGEMDPVEALQRAIRQAQRNQQNGRGGCDDCTYSVVEAGANVNYGDSCEPPDKFKPFKYSYPGYMELRKKCGN